MFGLSRVVVAGNSMSPTFNQGDWLIVRKLSGQKHRLRIGKLYLVADPVRPGVALLKLESELILGKVLIRYKRGD